MTTVATLAPATAASAAAVLARAFDWGPMMVYPLPDCERRARLLPPVTGSPRTSSGWRAGGGTGGLRRLPFRL